MGETAEARRAYETALALEAAGYEETDAAAWLAQLPARNPQRHTERP